MFQCWPSPWSMCSLTVFPSLRWKISYLLSTAWMVYSPGGTSLRLRMGYPQALASTTVGWPGCQPSTVRPKTICERGVSSIWLRGSSLGSVERTSKRRPSRGSALTSFGKETENDWAAAATGKSRRRARAVRFMLATILRGANAGRGLRVQRNSHVSESRPWAPGFPVTQTWATHPKSCSCTPPGLSATSRHRPA